MPLVFIDNPEPSEISGPVVYVWVDPTVSHRQQLNEVAVAMAGIGDFIGHAAGDPGAINTPPLRVASDDPQLAAALAADFSVAAGTLDVDGEELDEHTCAVVEVDELAGEYQQINADEEA